ncbi:MAG: thioredoxin family protein [Comamonas sp.]
MNEAATAPWLVVCLCADWCGVCKQYRPAFDALAEKIPAMQFAWLDVEDEEGALGDLDIATFPTVLVGQGDQAVFMGPLLPQIGVLQRMLDSFANSEPHALPIGDEAHALLLRARALIGA